MDVNELFLKMMDEFVENEIPIPVNRIQKSLNFCNATSYGGYCTRFSGGFIITISQAFLNNEKMVKKILAHELIHTCPDCFNHGPEFVKISKMVDERLNISVSAVENFDLSDVIKQRAKYQIICPECGFSEYRQKMSKVIKYHNQVICPECGKIGLNIKKL